eukprot:m51a1_g225 hypothetical protein (1376) ;mRNA; f:77022-81747
MQHALVAPAAAGLAPLLALCLAALLANALAQGPQWPAFSKTGSLGDGVLGVHLSQAPLAFSIGAHVASGSLTDKSRSDLVVAAKGAERDRYRAMLLDDLAWGRNRAGAYITSGDATCDGVWVGDVDGDGYGDAVLATGNKGRTVVVWGRPKADFPGYVDADNCTSVDGVAVGVGDIDSDGRADVILGSGAVVLGRADRALSARLSLALAANESISTAAPVGDVNGDGVADTALGVRSGPGHRVVVLLGNSSGAPVGSAAGGRVGMGEFGGFSVSAPGWTSVSVGGGCDANGDGVDDVLIGTLAMGRSFVVFGRRGMQSRATEVAGVDVTIEGRDGASGATLVCAGDIDADGHADLAVASPRPNDRADVAVLLGPLGNKTSVQLSAIDGTSLFDLETQATEENATVVAAAGDFNLDGIADLVVVSPHASGNEMETMEAVADMGRLYVLFGARRNATRWPSFPVSLNSIHWSSGTTGGSGSWGLCVAASTRKVGFGSYVRGVGDTNGDGAADVLISVPNVPPKVSGMPTGENLLVLGHRGKWNRAVDLGRARDIQEEEQFTVCGGIGDWDGDGFSDIAVKMKEDNKYEIRYGPGLSWRRSVRIKAMRCPVGLGDFNGDGLDDVAITHWDYTIHIVMGGFKGTSIIDTESNSSTSPGFYFSREGYSAVARIGDINCDGFADMGVVGYSELGESPTVLWVVPGAAHYPPGLNNGQFGSPYAKILLTGEVSETLTPQAAGDVNGDGCDDFVIEQSLYWTKPYRTVNTLIYFGNPSLTVINTLKPSTFDGHATVVLSSELSSEIADLNSGIHPTSYAVGDINGDGLGDVAVPGRGCQVVFGKKGPWDPKTPIKSDGVSGTYVIADTPNYVFCFPTGDVNNDSVADLIVTVQPDQDVWVFFGNRQPQLLLPIASLPGCCTASVGNAMSFSVDKAFSITGDVATWTAQGMPSWLHFNETTRMFSGTPNRSSDALTSRVVVTVTDSHGMAGTQEFSVTVRSSLVLSTPALAVQCSGSTCELPKITVDGAHNTSVLKLELGVSGDCAGVYVTKSGASALEVSAGHPHVVAGNSSALQALMSGLSFRDSKTERVQCLLVLLLSDEYGQNVSVSLAAASRSNGPASQSGAIAGGVVGCTVFVTLVGSVVAIIALRRRRRRMGENGDLTEHHVWSVNNESWPAISEQLREHPDSDYVLVAASQADTEFVQEAYSRCPVPGMAVGSIDVVYCPALERLFEARAHQLQGRSGNRAFEPGWLREADAAVRAPVSDMLVRMTAPLRDGEFPDVQLLPLWHGTDKENLDSILRAGYANLAKTDVGFFGKGVYSTYEARYAHEVYSKGSLVLNWVSFYSAYPVVEGDMLKLQGKGNFSNYDAHFFRGHLWKHLM